MKEMKGTSHYDRFVMSLREDRKVQYTLMGKPVKNIATSRPVSLYSKGCKTKVRLPEVQLSVRGQTLLYQMQQEDQIALPLHKKDLPALDEWRIEENAVAWDQMDNDEHLRYAKWATSFFLFKKRQNDSENLSKLASS